MMDRHHAMNATRVSYTLESTLASVNKAEQAAAEVAAKSGFGQDECWPHRHGCARSHGERRSCTETATIQPSA